VIALLYDDDPVDKDVLDAGRIAVPLWQVV